MAEKIRITKGANAWQVELPVVGFAHPGMNHVVTGFVSQRSAFRWCEGYWRYRTKPS